MTPVDPSPRQPLRILVVDAYDDAGRESLRSVGATPAGRLYAGVLQSLDRRLVAEVVEADRLAAAPPRLSEYAGVVWTGSNLTIHRSRRPVDLQLELCRAAFAAAVPQFGSCWAIQLAAVAAGGACATNPRGREFGVARRIRPTPEGAGHPLLRGRGESFEAFASHEDMVVALPPGARHLASNDFAAIQALEVRVGDGVFWAVQYHPEYDFHEVGCLARLRREQLVREGCFADEAEARQFADDFERLQASSSDEELRRRHQVSAELADDDARRLEIRNWLATLAGGAS